MPQIYQSSDVFVLGSIDEIFGIVFLEAMSCSVPVIAHDFPVTKWIVGEGGDIIDMTKEHELENAITKYFDNDYKRKKGRGARRRVENNFSKEAIVSTVIDMYDKVLEGGAR
jgi:glycosyltransferase involved in cell wall biosynthesis